jgi:hypothetical protein
LTLRSKNAALSIVRTPSCFFSSLLMFFIYFTAF